MKLLDNRLYMSICLSLCLYVYLSAYDSVCHLLPLLFFSAFNLCLSFICSFFLFPFSVLQQFNVCLSLCCVFLPTLNSSPPQGCSFACSVSSLKQERDLKMSFRYRPQWLNLFPLLKGFQIKNIFIFPIYNI